MACKHGFTWTSANSVPSHPPEHYVTHCGMCGTWATWRDGAWHVGEQSPGSLAIGHVEQLQDALEEILNTLGPNGKPCSENGCEGCQHEMDAARDIAKGALGL